VAGACDDSGGKAEQPPITNLKERLFGPLLPLGLGYLTLAMLEYSLQNRRAIVDLMRRHRTVILDRYWYDLVVDAVGSSERARSRAARIIRACRDVTPLPQPDLVIVLDVEAQEAVRRKRGENPVEFVAARRRAYLDVADAIGGIVIDATPSLPVVQTNVMAAIRANSRES
jgi:thymidylate kinase